jgi:hypothetical protein
VGRLGLAASPAPPERPPLFPPLPTGPPLSAPLFSVRAAPAPSFLSLAAWPRTSAPPSPFLLPSSARPPPLFFLPAGPAARSLAVARSAAPRAPFPLRRTQPSHTLAWSPRLGSSRSAPALGLDRAATKSVGSAGSVARTTRTPRLPYPFFLAAAVPRAVPQPPLHRPAFPVPSRRRAIARSRECAAADPPCAAAIRPRDHGSSASNRRRSTLGW